MSMTKIALKFLFTHLVVLTIDCMLKVIFICTFLSVPGTALRLWNVVIYVSVLLAMA